MNRIMKYKASVYSLLSTSKLDIKTTRSVVVVTQLPTTTTKTSRTNCNLVRQRTTSSTISGSCCCTSFHHELDTIFQQSEQKQQQQQQQQQRSSKDTYTKNQQQQKVHSLFTDQQQALNGTRFHYFYSQQQQRYFYSFHQQNCRTIHNSSRTMERRRGGNKNNPLLTRTDNSMKNKNRLQQEEEQQDITKRNSESLLPTVSDVDPSSSSSESSSLSTPTSHVPIDFSQSSSITGDESHVVTMTLHPGEVLRTESGAMIYMTEGIVMDTKLNGTSSTFNRFLTGQNMFLTDFYYEGTSSGTVCLGTDFPSKILRYTLDDHPNSTLICQRGAYLASNPTVDITMEFTKSFTSGFFGGQGFILQRLCGTGDVLIKGGGTIKELVLVNENDTLRVTSGSIVAFESTVQYDVQMMPGIKNVMFGGQGLFVTTLRGPGRVWLQGLPPDRMIAEIARRIPSSSGIGFGIPIGGFGGGGGDGSSSVGDGTVSEAGGTGTDNVTGTGGMGDGGLATDAAIQADRNATVATSGIMSNNDDGGGGVNGPISIDPNSQTTLFGDEIVDTNNIDKEFMSSSDFGTDDEMLNKFSEGGTKFGDFDDNTNMTEDTLLNDDGTEMESSSSSMDVLGVGSEEASSGSTSFLRSIWDFFSGDD